MTCLHRTICAPSCTDEHAAGLLRCPGCRAGTWLCRYQLRHEGYDGPSSKRDVLCRKAGDVGKRAEDQHSNTKVASACGVVQGPSRTKRRGEIGDACISAAEWLSRWLEKGKRTCGSLLFSQPICAGRCNRARGCMNLKQLCLINIAGSLVSHLAPLFPLSRFHHAWTIVRDLLIG